MKYIRWSFLFAAVAVVAACKPFVAPPSPDGGDGIEAAPEGGGVGELPGVGQVAEVGNAGPNDGAVDLREMNSGDGGIVDTLPADLGSADRVPVDILSDTSSDSRETSGSQVVLGPPGSLIWARNTVLEGTVLKTAVLQDDTIIVAGTFERVAHFGPSTTLTTSGDQDLFLARYTSEGAIVWAVQAGGPQDDQIGGLAVFPDGTIALTGAFAGTAVFGQGRDHQVSLSSAGSWDVFLATYASTGDLVWALRAGGSGYEYSDGLAVRPDGGLSLRGRWSSDIGSGFVNPSVGSFVARLAVNGQSVWVRGFDPDNSGAYDCIAVNSDGATVFCGSSESPVHLWFPEPSFRTVPALGPIQFIASATPAGDVSWANHVAVPGADYSARYVISLPGGDVAMGGSTPASFHSYGDPSSNMGADPVVQPPSGDAGIFVARYSAGGYLGSVVSMDAAQIAASGGVSGGDGSVVVAGTFEGAVSEMPSVRSAGGADLFLAKITGDGHLGWITRAGGAGQDSVAPPVVLSDGTVVIVGSFVNLATFGKGEPEETNLTAPQSGTGQFVARFSP